MMTISKSFYDAYPLLIYSILFSIPILMMLVLPILRQIQTNSIQGGIFSWSPLARFLFSSWSQVLHCSPSGLNFGLVGNLVSIIIFWSSAAFSSMYITNSTSHAAPQNPTNSNSLRLHRDSIVNLRSVLKEGLVFSICNMEKRHIQIYNYPSFSAHAHAWCTIQRVTIPWVWTSIVNVLPLIAMHKQVWYHHQHRQPAPNAWDFLTWEVDLAGKAENKTEKWYRSC